VKVTLSGVNSTRSTVDFSFLSPRGVAVDGHGNVYVADTEHRQAVKETPSDGIYTKSFVGPGTMFPGGQDED
jgi:hypothetical protein